MTLKEWARDWPYLVRPHETRLMWHTPDSCEHDTHRRKAFRLDDVRVWSVSGGSIWFASREPETGDYRVSVYYHEDFANWESCDTPEEAVRVGLRFLKESASHTVHITRPSLLFGICIMRNRPQDLAASHAEWVEILKKTEFR